MGFWKNTAKKAWFILNAARETREWVSYVVAALIAYGFVAWWHNWVKELNEAEISALYAASLCVLVLALIIFNRIRLVIKKWKQEAASRRIAIWEAFIRKIAQEEILANADMIKKVAEDAITEREDYLEESKERAHRLAENIVRKKSEREELERYRNLFNKSEPTSLWEALKSSAQKKKEE